MERDKKNWFGLITETVLERSGPSRAKPRAADLLTGQPTPPPGDQLTKDIYGQLAALKENKE